MIDRIFAFTGRVAARFRWVIIPAWFILAAAVTLLAPPLDSVVSSNTRDFLPANAPYAQAEAAMKANFPNDSAKTTAALVIEAPGGNIRQEPVWGYLTGITNWLRGSDKPENVGDITSPASSPLLADALISADSQVAIIMVDLTTDTQLPVTGQTLKAFETYAAKDKPQGVNFYVTGVAPIIFSYSQATITSVDRTTGITVVLVILILLLVYRSPVSPFIPLLTVAASYLISRGLIAWVAKGGVTVSSYVSVMLVVVLFGAGTDYCLFLISRFREELADNSDVSTATQRTVHRVAETLASSAGTVIVGFVTMLFSEMGLFRNSGPVLAIGILVVLLAGLTLTPALLAVLGKHAFWPGRASHRETGRFYARLSALVSERPVQTILVIVIVLAPFSFLATEQRITYDLLADLPKNYGARAGYQVLETHMGGGQMQPLNVVLSNLKPETTLAEIDRWTKAMRAVPGVADVRSLSDPLGVASKQVRDITRVDTQLTLAADLLGQVSRTAGSGQTSADPAQLALATKALPFVKDYLETLKQKFPEAADNADLAAIQTTLNGLPMAALTGSLNKSLEALQTHLRALAPIFKDKYYLPSALPKDLVDALGGEDPLATLTARYLKPDGTAARFEVIVKGNPYSSEAMDCVIALRALLPGGPAAVGGASVVMTDLRETINRDMLRAFAFVLLGIFAVLVFLLRALVSPIYLILTILLSYSATLGITRLLSTVIFGTAELTWWAPFFMFVMLVALGMDYNIFLMGRVKEEVAQHGVREGVHRAIIATGAIITSAGIIMAGTFSAMMSSVIIGLGQLGLAVSVGVLLDTFVIRTALVPAIVVWLDRWNWWPGRSMGQKPAGVSADEPA